MANGQRIAEPAGDTSRLNEVVLRVRGASKTYSSTRGIPIPALTDIDLDVRRGEFLSLIGPSGCGKSTLLHSLGGMHKITSGSIHLGDQEVVGPRPEEIAFVFQDYSLFPWRTVLSNVQAGLEFRGMDRARRREIAREKLAVVGLERFADAYPAELSGGMQQRVAIARALTLEPKLLLMDEPFGALDEQTRTVLGEELSRILSDTDTTIVFVTHSLGEAVLLSDRVVVMTSRPGRIKKILTIDAPRPRDGDFIASDTYNEMRSELYLHLREEIQNAVSAEYDGGGR
jgi:NitT/TauT family transport system ATP-binding protein